MPAETDAHCSAAIAARRYVMCAERVSICEFLGGREAVARGI